MIALIQRVSRASVSVDGELIAQIGAGILALIGVERDDNQASARRLVERLLGYRIFSDADDRMNLSLLDTAGELLLVPQFTLAADTNKGMRPSFTTAAPPSQGAELFDFILAHAKENYAADRVASGQFGADMQVSLVNSGPVTFWLQTPAGRS